MSFMLATSSPICACMRLYTKPSHSVPALDEENVHRSTMSILVTPKLVY